MNDIVNLSEYRDWLRDLKQQIRIGQVKASLSVNSQMIMLYWDLGRQIVEKQENAKWGSGFIEQLSKDLREEFPEMKGFSRSNLFRMQKFYKFYSPVIQHDEFVPQVVGQISATEKPIVAQLGRQIQSSDLEKDIIIPQLERQLEWKKILLIPWKHNVCIFEKVKDLDQALFYVNKTIENNWSRAVLEYQIETNLYGRQGKAITNFNLTLPTPQSDLANAIMKDPYNNELLNFEREHSKKNKIDDIIK